MIVDALGQISVGNRNNIAVLAPVKAEHMMGWNNVPLYLSVSGQ